ncbi:SO2930 family diheme c-type cytochrome [Chitinophaga sp. YIM B06452]|uniref:SO2930 family diheme c-type cytochrome n=1 Tax=Chitinophaga sp. YIM B06452 TaxID=3082158 RepID=UPI0031FEA518
MRYVIVLILAMTTLYSCRPKKPATTSGFLEKLSDYGFFKGKLSQLSPEAHVHRYDLATPLFTDYAIKDRFIALPEGTGMQYRDSGALQFPDGTFIIKNFSYRDTAGNKVLIETRLLHKDPQDGKWKVMNYLWNAAQTEAEKWIAGKQVPITLLDDHQQRISTLYQVPNTNDCKRCHSSNGTLLPIGPKARNLHYGKGEQLLQWASAGILQDMPDISRVPALPVWTDSLHYSISQRARAYLDVNCAHCHTKGGDADNTGLFLEYDQQQPAHLGILKGPVSAGNGAGGLDFDIVPGNAAASILTYRMNSTEPGTAMPELARTLVHKEGVALIVQWINEMKKEQ